MGIYLYTISDESKKIIKTGKVSLASYAIQDTVVIKQFGQGIGRYLQGVWIKLARIQNQQVAVPLGTCRQRCGCDGGSDR